MKNLQGYGHSPLEKQKEKEISGHVLPTKGGTMKLVVSTTSTLVPTLPAQFEMEGVSRNKAEVIHSPAISSREGTCAWHCCMEAGQRM